MIAFLKFFSEILNSGTNAVDKAWRYSNFFVATWQYIKTKDIQDLHKDLYVKIHIFIVQNVNCKFILLCD